MTVLSGDLPCNNTSHRTLCPPLKLQMVDEYGTNPNPDPNPDPDPNPNPNPNPNPHPNQEAPRPRLLRRPPRPRPLRRRVARRTRPEAKQAKPRR